MARTYDDIYFTNCNGELHLHLDGPSGTNESVTDATYFRVQFHLVAPIYQSGYSGNGCSKWVTGLQYKYSDQFPLTNDDDLDLVLDFNDTDSEPFGYYDEDNGGNSNFNTPGGHDDCFENNWWKDGLRMSVPGGDGTGIKVLLNYYKNNDTSAGAAVTVGTNRTDNRPTGAVYIYNAPDGTSGRALIDDDNTTRSGTPYGVTSTPLQSMATTSGCTGDPHVTTFDGCKYTL